MLVIAALIERLRLASPQRLLLVGEAGHRHGAGLRAAIDESWPTQAPSLVLVDQLDDTPTSSPALPEAENDVVPGEQPVRTPNVRPNVRPDAQLEAAVLTVDDHTPAPDVLLGHACRRYPVCLLVEHRTPELQDPAHPPIDGGIQPELFYALGFLRRYSVLDGLSRCTLYEYCLRNYKPAPAWLNARYWANPERFDCDPDE